MTDRSEGDLTGPRPSRLVAIGAIAIAVAALAACGDGGDDTGTDDASADEGASDGGGSPCLDLGGATLAQIEEMFGREADHVEDYDGVPGSYFWYFGDDDQVVVSFEGDSPSSETNGYAWHDGDEFMVGRAECPLPEPGPDHPSKFNIEDGE